jgi:hypothetical protein
MNQPQTLTDLARAGYYVPTGSLSWFDFRNSSGTVNFDAAVFKLTSFFPVGASGTFDYAGFRTAFEQAIAHAQSRQYKRLILDITNNVGGSVAVAEQVAMYLVKEWDAGSTRGIQNGFMTFDQRADPESDALYAASKLPVNDLKKLQNFGQISAVEFYGTKVSRTRNGMYVACVQRLFLITLTHPTRHFDYCVFM